MFATVDVPAGCRLSPPKRVDGDDDATGQDLDSCGSFGFVAAACSWSDDTTTTVAPATTTTSAAVTTTTAAPITTTTAAETEDPAAVSVDPTTAIGVLQPYNDGGEARFSAGSVEAHWYQWDGNYVVPYRGWEAASGREICAGNSILPPAGPLGSSKSGRQSRTSVEKADHLPAHPHQQL